MKHNRVLDVPDGVEAVTMTTDRGEFAALVARPADNDPVGAALLIPGWTGSKEDFVAVLHPMAKAGWLVATYDQRGQYESSGYADAGDYTWSNLAADAVAVAAWLEQDGPVHLVGHSFGGLVSANAAAGHPMAWASVTLLCSGPAGKPDEASQQGLELVAESLESLPEDPDERLAGMGMLWDVKRRIEAASGAEIADSDSEQFFRTRFMADDPVGLAAFSRMLASAPDRIDDVVRSELPGYVVYGEDDDAWPTELQDQMASRLGTTPVVIAGAGHSPTVDQPETTADVLVGLWCSTLGETPTDDDPAA